MKSDKLMNTTNPKKTQSNIISKPIMEIKVES